LEFKLSNWLSAEVLNEILRRKNIEDKKPMILCINNSNPRLYLI